MRNPILFIVVGLLSLMACNTENSTEAKHILNSYEIPTMMTTYDTINMVVDGKRQGLWLMPISKDTVIYHNDTAYSVTAPMTSGEMIRFLKSGYNGGFQTYDSLVVKSN